MITKEAIIERLERLKADRDQVMGNLNALEGAIIDCQYWLEQLEKPEEDKEA